MTNKIYTGYWSDKRNECTKTTEKKKKREKKRERKIFIKDSFTVLQIAYGKEEEEENSLISSDISFLCVENEGGRERREIEMIEKKECMVVLVGITHTHTRICTEFMLIENK